MIRKDNLYWQRLRKDRRSNWAAGMAALAAIAASISIIGVLIAGSQYEARANPLYWVLMVPALWWLSGLARFEPRPVRWWRPALFLCVSVAGIALFLGIQREDPMPEIAGFVITCTGTVISLILLRHSLVEQEGPAR